MKEKHPYINVNNLKNYYDQTHYVPDDKKRDVAEFLHQNLPTDSNCIRILDAGIGSGKDFLIPLLEKIKENNKIKEIYLCGFDNSDSQLAKAVENIKGFVEKSKNLKIYYTIKKIDIEEIDDLLKEFNLNDSDKFDWINCQFLLHHTLNWRESLLKLVKVLKIGGKIIIAERCNDIELLDGNFKNLAKMQTHNHDSFHKFLYEYFKLKSKIFLWNPEIRATDYSALIEFLSPYFELTQKHFQWQYPISLEEIKKWIKNKVYTHFWIGLNEEGERIINNFLDGVKNQEEITLYDGYNVSILTYNKEFKNFGYLNTKLISDYINPNLITFSKSNFDIYDLSKNFIDLCVTHDIMIPRKTLFFSINIWDLINDTWYPYIPLIVNKTAFDIAKIDFKCLINYIFYLIYTRKVGFSMTQFLFMELKKKPKFIKVKLAEKFDVKLKMEYNKIEEIEFYLPEVNINSAIEESCSKICNNEIYSLIQNRLLHLRSETYFLKIDPELVTELGKNWEFDIDFKTNEWVETLKKEVLYIFQLKDEQLNLLAKSLFGLYLFFVRYKEELIYIPSVSLVEETQDDLKEIGFGGIILCENMVKTQEWVNDLGKMRLEIFHFIAHLFFSRIGIVNWSKKEKDTLVRHALRSAVAAIMSRNMSHNIGSHVLNYLSNPEELDKLWVI